MKTLQIRHKTFTFLTILLLLTQLILSCSSNNTSEEKAKDNTSVAPTTTTNDAQLETLEIDPANAPQAPQPSAPLQKSEANKEQLQTQNRAIANNQVVNESIAPEGGILADKTDAFIETEEEDQDLKQEEYSLIEENPFEMVKFNPLSTFSIDVDPASYSNVRRYINQGQLPPQDAVRIEELINYFTYDYTQPSGNNPFSLTTEISQTPWNNQHKLVHIGIQGKKIATEDLPPSNLVFLFDVSGSMNNPDKLPLLKSGFRLLVNELTEKDRVSIVVYAGSSGLVLPSTPGNQKDTILQAIDNLQAGGSTAGGKGINLAYEEAKKHFIEGGNNRVILATDGDFNVGPSSDADLVRLIEEKRDDGIFLTVLGFGTGNIKDSKMESLANKGNGNYAYIDSILEARKVLVTEMGATLLTIAKDVKIQVEFNPEKVQAYRLIGYENRLLQAQDFNDDTKDAGELGAGHSVTALYEIIPTGVDTNVNLPEIDDLKYQTTNPDTTITSSNELMEVKLRYKAPDSDTSQLIRQGIVDDAIALSNTSDNFRFSAAVAEFGMILRGSQYKGNTSFNTILDLAKNSQSADLDGYRAEFIRLVESAQKLN